MTRIAAQRLETGMTVLAQLLAGAGSPVSGRVIAEKLGLSRVAVWNRVEMLRRNGFQIEAAPHRGYRFLAGPDRLSADYLRLLLPRHWRKVALEVFDHLDSTNSEGERRLSRGETVPFILISESQSRGRGRLGRTWLSAPENNLYATFGFRPQISPRILPRFTLWMGVVVCRFLRAHTGLKTWVKWPNDLILDGRKAGGMLTEARIDTDQTRDLLFGLGLNINGDGSAWPPALREKATSLYLSSGKRVDRHRLTAGLAAEILDAAEAFGEAIGPRLQKLWPETDWLYNRDVTAFRGAESIRGTARGINEEGGLIVETAAGPRVLHAGEATLAGETPLPEIRLPESMET